jgi:hypothetical protein
LYGSLATSKLTRCDRAIRPEHVEPKLEETVKAPVRSRRPLGCELFARRGLRGFDRYAYREREDRRFHFDSMDTLPYWYSRALRAFADVSEGKFLDTAEGWIVDRWDVQGNPWRWDDEPRKGRLSDHSLDHRHGSRPTMERFHTYLEWASDVVRDRRELMQARALARAGEDDYDTFERWLSRDGLTASPLWLADLCGMKPLEDRLWFGPQDDVNTWVENAGDDDFSPS